LALDVPDEWVFEDEGHSGATLIRPALERMRDLIASVGIDVVLCYSPDRPARKFAYQALLLEEFARAGTRVEFIKGPRGDSPEDWPLVQFQGMFAEYEKAQILERYRIRQRPFRASRRPPEVRERLRRSPGWAASRQVVRSVLDPPA
jgi:site-specific DNA recombinase